MSGPVYLRASDRVASPWKNGGGETATIAVFPAHAGLDDFDWRISIARVDGDGPFSCFPGIDRTLTILSGGAMALNGVELTPDSDPYAFDGDVPVMATVTGGPIHDLNVMTRRGRFAHRVARVRAPLFLAASDDIRLLVALDDDIDGMARWDVVMVSGSGGIELVGQGSALLITLRSAD